MTTAVLRTTVAVAATIFVTGCGGGARSPVSSTGVPAERGEVTYKGPAPASETRHVVVKRLPHFGWVLVDGKGYPLYAFVPDAPGSRCIGACAAAWPPFQLTHGKVLDMSPLLSVSRFVVEPDPEGGRMVRYNGWLLHSYTGETSSKLGSGQGLDSYGGHWYLISPSGKLRTRGA